MPLERTAAQRLYRKLLSHYPRAFRDRLGESMQQTFDDLYHERGRSTGRGFPGFLPWIFLETAAGIIREHLLLISPGGLMLAILKSFPSSTLISLLCISPFILMEIVNRREFNEDFPYNLFFVMWLNLFSILIILLPLGLGIWRAKRSRGQDAPAGQALSPTNFRSTAILSLGLFLLPLILYGLDSLGWLPLGKLLNGPNPEVFFWPGWIINLAFFIMPVAAGMIASTQIVRAMRAGGGLFAHPILWIIVLLVSTFIAIGLVNLILDQWPCFIGIPVCD